MHARPLIIVTSGLRTGGAEAMLVKLLERIDRGKFKPIVVSLTGDATHGARLRQMGIPVESFNARRPTELARAINVVRSLISGSSRAITQGWMYSQLQRGGDLGLSSCR